MKKLLIVKSIFLCLLLTSCVNTDGDEESGKSIEISEDDENFGTEKVYTPDTFEPDEAAVDSLGNSVVE